MNKFLSAILFSCLYISLSSIVTAQQILGLTKVDIDPASQTIKGYHLTELDAAAWAYYDPYVNGMIYEALGDTFNIVDRKEKLEDKKNFAETFTHVTGKNGWVYPVYSDHWIGYVRTIYVPAYGGYRQIDYFGWSSFSEIGQTDRPQYSINETLPVRYVTSYLDYLFSTTYWYLSPHIDSITPSNVIVGSTVNVTVKGVGFHDDAVLDIPGLNVSITGKSKDSEGWEYLNLSISVPPDANTGNHAFRILHKGFTSNTVNLNVSDRTPQIESIAPSVLEAGSSTEVTIIGSGFGANPSLDVSAEDIEVAVLSSSDTQIKALFTIAATAPEGSRSVTVHSRGRTGNGFIAAPGTSATSNSALVSVLNKEPQIELSKDQRINDGEIATFSVTAKNGTPVSYKWSYEVSENAGNLPSSDIFLSNGKPSVEVRGHWFAYPDKECDPGSLIPVADPEDVPFYNSVYKIKCDVTFNVNGREVVKQKSSKLTVNVYYRPLPEWVKIDPDIKFNNIPGVTPGISIKNIMLETGWDAGIQAWRPTKLQFRQELPKMQLHPELTPNSQFYEKIRVHEGQHENQWKPGGMFSHLYNVNDAFNYIKELRVKEAGTSGRNKLQEKIESNLDKWAQKQLEQREKLRKAAEIEAYKISDQVKPLRLFQGKCSPDTK
jgi:hypothetical protein